MKAWLRRWLETPSLALLAAEEKQLRDEYRAFKAELSHERASDIQKIRDWCNSAMMNLKADQDATIAELIQEINALRNSIPSAVAQAAKPPVRVMRNFREFRDTVEHKPQTQRKA